MTSLQRFAVPLMALAAVTVARGQPPRASVVVAEAEPRKLPNTATLVGTVEPITRSVVGSEIPGIVESMPVREGDLVQSGTRIIMLNSDTIRWQLAEAIASHKAAQARLSQAEFEVKRIDALYDRSQSNEKEVYDARAEFDVARFEVEMQKARMNRLQTDLRKTEITAPFTGYVVQRLTEVGQWIEQGGDVVEMIDLASVLVRVDVPESAIGYVKTDDPCSVYVDALKQTFQGKVWRIIRQADADARTFPVEVIVKNTEQSLAAGMFARATLISGPNAEVVAVPKDAIVERDGIRYVGTVFPGEHGKMGMLTPVTTGADVQDWIAVTSGNVQAGTQVVIRGNERMFLFPAPVNIVDLLGTPVESTSARGNERPGPGR